MDISNELIGSVRFCDLKLTRVACCTLLHSGYNGQVNKGEQTGIVSKTKKILLILTKNLTNEVILP